MLELPTHTQLEITDNCNLRCKYCYHFDTDKMPESKDLDDKKIIQLVQKLVEARIYSLVITGGEPFTRPALVIKIIEIAKKAGIFVSVNTNLLLVTQEIVNELKRVKVDSLLVSCPSSDHAVYKKITRCGDYNQLRYNLQLLLKADISCMVNMVVTPVNVNLIRRTASDLFNIGVRRFAATPASLNVEYPSYDELLNRKETIFLLEELKWCSENIGIAVDILEPLPKCFLPDWCWENDYAFTKRSCQAGRLSISISNTGDVRPCSHNPVSYGNLFNENLDSIWSKMHIYVDNSTPLFCKKCPSASSCNGACRTNSLASTGFLNKLDRFVVGHIDIKTRTEITIKENSTLEFNGSLRWRKEFENYSISSKKAGANIIIVNEEMFLFVQWAEEHLPMTVSELFKGIVNNSEKNDFIKIIKVLIKKEFLNIK